MVGWKTKRLDGKRADALSSITGDRVHIELMAQRARPAEDPLDRDLLQTVLNNLTAIEASARTVNSITELDDLIEDGELQGIASAYFCPAGEIQDEGNRAIDNLELWGIPAASTKKLRENFTRRLEQAPVSPYAARAALHAIFIEVAEWTDYIDAYEETMRKYTLWLFGSAIVLLLVAGLCFYFAYLLPLAVWFGLIAAGAAGSSASVMAKMPSLDLSLSGELDAYGRRIKSRIATGTIGSLIGIALMGWGVLPLSIKDLPFTDALVACSSRAIEPCPIIKMLIVLGVAMLLGVSERTLTSVEQRMFGERSSQRAPRIR